MSIKIFSTRHLWIVKDDTATRAFGLHLRKLREKKEWSQQRLADEADMAKQTVQRIEWGQLNATLTTLMKLSKALDIPLAELVTFSEHP